MDCLRAEGTPLRLPQNVVAVWRTGSALMSLQARCSIGDSFEMHLVVSRRGAFAHALGLTILPDGTVERAP